MVTGTSIKILGIGNFGYALLYHFDQLNQKAGGDRYNVSAYTRDKDVFENLQSFYKHPFIDQCPTISKNVVIENDLPHFLKDTQYLILAVSSNAVVEVLQDIAPYLTSPITLINTAKALDHQTGKCFSLFAKKIMPACTYAVLSGGTIAQDLFKKEPLGVDIACENKDILSIVQNLFNSGNITAYPTVDVIGVEYAGAFKNVVAILAGIIKGMGYSYGSETHIITRAAFEVEELVVRYLGGTRETFSMYSQSWGNDLWMSCTGNTRNRQFGVHIGKGLSLNEGLSRMLQQKQLVEGINTLKVLHTIEHIEDYPLLNFMQNFYQNKATLKDLQAIIFKHHS